MIEIHPGDIEILVSTGLLSRPSVTERDNIRGLFAATMYQERGARKFTVAASFFGREVCGDLSVPRVPPRDDRSPAPEINWAAYSGPQDGVRLGKVHECLAKDLTGLVPQLSTHERLRLHQVLQR